VSTYQEVLISQRIGFFRSFQRAFSRSLISALILAVGSYAVGYFMGIQLLHNLFILLLANLVGSLIGVYEAVPKVTVSFSKRGFFFGWLFGLVLSLFIFVVSYTQILS